MEIRIYFEGMKMLRAGFEKLFSDLRNAAREAHCELYIVAAKNGPTDYHKALRSHASAWNILLKDSEQPIPASIGDLLQRHGLSGADQVFWMVELMESWFLAHPEALARY
jgi:hypothetical protein